MCSTDGGQLGRICRAIDELAACSASSDHATAGGPATAASEDGAAQAGATRPTGAADRAGSADQAGLTNQTGATHQTGAGAARRAGSADRAGPTRQARRDDDDIARLAAIWEMVADADPELAKRLPGYLSAAE
jgi:hypothetical protein